MHLRPQPPVPRRVGRSGFTLLELLVAVIVLGIIAGVAMPATATIMSQTRAGRAASVVASDLQTAFSLAVREKEPLVLTVNAAGRSYTVANRAGTPLLTRRLGSSTAPASVNSMTTSATTRTFFPNGMASGSVSITLVVNGHTRQVDMSRVGLVRVSAP